MPFSRKRGRRTFKGRRTRKFRRLRYKGTRSMAAKALTGVYKLRGLINSEMHKLDTEISGSMVSTWSLNPIHLIAQGDAYNQRAGNAVLVRAINWKGSVIVNDLNSPIQCCICLIQDTQQIDSNVPNGGDIFEQQTPYSHLNHKYVGRFKILARKNFALNKEGRPEAVFNINVPLYTHLRWSGVLSSAICKNGLYTCIIGTAVSDYPQIVSTVRLSYHDN